MNNNDVHRCWDGKRLLKASKTRCQGFLIIVFALHAILLIGCLYVANKVKNVPEEYHESKYIFIGIFSMTQIYMVAVPVAFAVYDSPIGRYIVLTSLIFLSCFILLALTIFPKIYFLTVGSQLVNFTTSLDVQAVASNRPDRDRQMSRTKNNNLTNN